MNDQMLPQRVRLFIFEHFLQHGAPPVVEAVMQGFSLSREAAADVLRVRCSGVTIDADILRGTHQRHRP